MWEDVWKGESERLGEEEGIGGDKGGREEEREEQAGRRRRTEGGRERYLGLGIGLSQKNP